MSRGYVSCISQMRQSSGFAPANIGNPVCPSTKSVRRSLGPSQFHNNPGRRGVIRRITAISLNLRKKDILVHKDVPFEPLLTLTCPCPLTDPDRFGRRLVFGVVQYPEFSIGWNELCGFTIDLDPCCRRPERWGPSSLRVGIPDPGSDAFEMPP